MTSDVDALDLLLLEIRRTIKENRLFLEKLVDETADESDTEADEPGPVTADENFEEL